MTIQIDKKNLQNLLRSENEKIMDLLLTFNVPDSIEGKKKIRSKEYPLRPSFNVA